MKYLLFIPALFLLSNETCNKKKQKTGEKQDVMVVEEAKDMPACIRKLLDDAAKTNPPEMPLQVDEYLFKDKTVYLVTADCCDQYNTLYDKDCKPICAPSGGFTGKGDNKCPEFNNEAKHVRILWSRKKQ